MYILIFETTLEYMDSATYIHTYIPITNRGIPALVFLEAEPDIHSREIVISQNPLRKQLEEQPQPKPEYQNMCKFKYFRSGIAKATWALEYLKRYITLSNCLLKGRLSSLGY